jgi:sortase A
MRRVLRILSVSLITAGFVLLLDVGLTLAWKEPVSAIYAALRQSEAADELEAVREDFLAQPQVGEIEARAQDADEERRAGELADLFSRRIENGEAIGRIQIGAIDADYVVVQGTRTSDLQRGPGHYPETALPGQGRTVAIAGHRTTYGAPFNQIDKIEKGDRISLVMPYGTFRYDVSGTRIVAPTQVDVVDDVGSERLVLSACHPLYSAAERYIVFADLVETEVLGEPAPEA